MVPSFVERIGAKGETIVLVKDTWDKRLVSPFQQEVLFVIEVNADRGINRLTEPNQVMMPSAGVYFILYYVVTANTHKLNMVILSDVPEGVACGHWDSASAKVLTHDAFHPVTWQSMAWSSPPNVDIKVLLKGVSLCHFQFKCFLSL